MRILVVSESFMTRESLGTLFEQYSTIREVIAIKSLSMIDKRELLNFSFIFIEVVDKNKDELDTISLLKRVSPNVKVMILDRTKSNHILEMAIKSKIEGYLLYIIDKDEFKYHFEKIKNGKRVYESEAIEKIIYNDIKSLDVLSKRERQVLDELAKGLNNKEIGQKLYIAECTVKKHVSNILQKLELKNRQEAIIYNQKLS